MPDNEKTKLQVGDRIYVNPGITVDEASAAKAKKGKGKGGRQSEVNATHAERWLARIEQIRALNKVDVYLCVSSPFDGSLPIPPARGGDTGPLFLLARARVVVRRLLG